MGLQGVCQKLIPHIQCRQRLLIQIDLLIRQTPGFSDGGVISGQRGKRRKLRRTVRHRHLRARLGDVVRKIDNLVVPIIHAHSVSHLLAKLELYLQI